MASASVGFIGVGNMGSVMARRLIEAGHQLVVYDVVADATLPLIKLGAKAASTIREVGDNSQVVFISVPTPDIVKAVAAELSQGAVVRWVVDLSTTGPAGAAEAATILRAHNINPVDCPVSGGVAGARAGTLALMVGAGDADLAEVRPLLEVFGRIFHVGAEPGMGQMMKVINNLMSAAALAISSEGVTMAVKAGLDAETVVDVLNAGSGRNSATLDKFPRQVLSGSFDAGFAVGLMLKDVNLCLARAQEMKLDLPVSVVVGNVWAKAAEILGPDADFTRIVEINEQPAGILIRRRQPVAAS